MLREEWVTKEDYDVMISQKEAEAQLSDVHKIIMFLAYVTALAAGFIFRLSFRLGNFSRPTCTTLLIIALTFLFMITGTLYHTPKMIETMNRMSQQIEELTSNYLVSGQSYQHDSLTAIINLGNADRIVSGINVYNKPTDILPGSEINLATAVRATSYEERLIRGEIRELLLKTHSEIVRSLIPIYILCFCLAFLVSVGWFWRSHFWELKNMPYSYFVSLLTKAISVVFWGSTITFVSINIFSNIMSVPISLLGSQSTATVFILGCWILAATILWQMKSRIFASPNDLHKLKAAVKEGDSDAMLHLAEAYIEGYGVDINYRNAYKLLSVVATEGNAVAQYKLGLLYISGNGVSEDISRAVHLFTTAAKSGEADAQYTLYCLFSTGKYVEQDHSQASYWLNEMQKSMSVNHELRTFKLSMDINWSEQINTYWDKEHSDECLKMGS